MAKNKCNHNRLINALCIVFFLIVLFLAFRWIQYYRYTSGKMSYEALTEFWKEGTYKRDSEHVPTKAYPKGWTESGTTVVKRNDNLYDVNIISNTVRVIPDKKNISLTHTYVFNFSPFTNQVRVNFKNTIGSHAHTAVKQIDKNTIVMYSNSYDSESIGKENIMNLCYFHKTKDGYYSDEYHSPNYGLTWHPWWNATYTRQS